MLAPVVVVLAAPLLLLAPTAGCMGPVPIPAPSVTPSYLVIRVVLPLPICKVVVQATATGFPPTVRNPLECMLPLMSPSPTVDSPPPPHVLLDSGAMGTFVASADVQ
jgi:hypothetical protein